MRADVAALWALAEMLTRAVRDAIDAGDDDAFAWAWNERFDVTGAYFSALRRVDSWPIMAPHRVHW